MCVCVTSSSTGCRVCSHLTPTRLVRTVANMRLDDACVILGCDKCCALEDAQSKYRRLALIHHPDRCPGDPGATAKFQTLGEAWSRFQRWKSDGFDDPATDDTWREQAAADPRSSSWWSSSWFGGGFGGYTEPQRCGQNCDCRFCRLEKKREGRRARAEAEAEAKAAVAAKRWEAVIAQKQHAAREWKERNNRERAAAAEAQEQAARAKAELERQAAEEAEAQAERERSELIEKKRQHDAQARLLRKQRTRLRTLVCAAHAGLADEVVSSLVTLLTAQLDAVALSALCEQVDAALARVDAEPETVNVHTAVPGVTALLQAAVAACKSREVQPQQEEEAAAGVAVPPLARSRRPAWTEQEGDLLSKAMVKVPGGVPDRWQKVAEMINKLAAPCHQRTADEVTHRVKELRKALEKQRGEHVAADMRAAAAATAVAKVATGMQGTGSAAPFGSIAPATVQAAASAPIVAPTLTATVRIASTTPSAPSAVSSTPPPAPPATWADVWTVEQQMALETALKLVPASIGLGRWDRIAEQVPGKTRAECVRRYKEIVSALKARVRS